MSTPKKILILGGSGFIGRHLVARLAAEQRDILVPARRRDRAKHLILLPGVEVIETDVHDEAALASLVHGREAVINLVGVLHSDYGTPWGKRFDAVHVALPRKVAQACVRAGVRRLVHMSALGADLQGPSMYSRSRAAGEQAVIDTLAGTATEWSILRPSVVFGPEDRFLNLFARMAKFSPVLPVAMDRARLQPVYVGDVVQALMAALDRPDTAGNIYPVTGPKVYELGELVQMAAEWGGHWRPVIGLPGFLGELQAAIMECLPGEPVLSRDNLDSLKVDNINPAGLAPELGIGVPTDMEAVAPQWLASVHPRNRYNEARARARRRSA
jgi:NADH dehydrogenase